MKIAFYNCMERNLLKYIQPSGCTCIWTCDVNVMNDDLTGIKIFNHVWHRANFRMNSHEMDLALIIWESRVSTKQYPICGISTIQHEHDIQEPQNTMFRNMMDADCGFNMIVNDETHKIVQFTDNERRYWKMKGLTS